MSVIACVGETLAERESGSMFKVLDSQMAGIADELKKSKQERAAGSAGVEGLWDRIVVAYEPVWAIGTGKTCGAAEANRICGLIRSWVGFEDVVVQYGGSVKADNIDQLMAQSDINGVLVGGASLDPVGFARIANYQVAVAA